MAHTDSTTGGRIIENGTLKCKITLTSACEVGDLLGYSSGWKPALATTGGAIYPFLVAGQAGAAADVITCWGGAVVSGTSGATAGGYLYAAESTLVGETTATAPSTGGDINSPVGFSLDATHMLLFPAALGPVIGDVGGTAVDHTA